jgi:hypothetical protein
MFDLNPLNILNQRQLTTLPPHFSKVKIADEVMLFDSKLVDWINTKLKNRFCIVKHPSVNSNGQLKLATFVGFEDQKELTYFMLACPHFRRKYED